MPLPPSGTITINQIRTELGSLSGSLRTLSSLAGFSTPDAMSEFWGYSNNNVTVRVSNSIGTNQVELYINSTSYPPYAFPPAFVGLTTYSNRPPGYVYVAAYEPNCFGVTIDYYLNGVYQQTFSTPGCDGNTGQISTSNGNTYDFYCYGGL